MDLKQLLPLLLKNKLGEREKALLDLAQSGETSAVPALLQMLEQNKTPRTELYATLKKIIPAETLGMIIKYLSGRS